MANWLTYHVDELTSKTILAMPFDEWHKILKFGDVLIIHSVQNENKWLFMWPLRYTIDSNWLVESEVLIVPLAITSSLVDPCIHYKKFLENAGLSISDLRMFVPVNTPFLQPYNLDPKWLYAVLWWEDGVLLDQLSIRYANDDAVTDDSDAWVTVDPHFVGHTAIPDDDVLKTVCDEIKSKVDAEMVPLVDVVVVYEGQQAVPFDVFNITIYPMHRRTVIQFDETQTTITPRDQTVRVHTLRNINTRVVRHIPDIVNRSDSRLIKLFNPGPSRRILFQQRFEQKGNLRMWTWIFTSQWIKDECHKRPMLHAIITELALIPDTILPLYVMYEVAQYLPGMNLWTRFEAIELMQRNRASVQKVLKQRDMPSRSTRSKTHKK